VDLYLVVNIGLIVGVLAVLGIVTWGIRRWRSGQLDRLFIRAVEWDEADNALETHRARARLVTKEFQALRRIVRFLNLATTVVALIPTGFAAYNLITNHQRQALNFNLAALATLLVTKGGLFLLTWILLPAVKAVPAAVTGAIISKKVSEVMDERKKKDQPPTR
jgi:hypothetical protein